MSPKPLVLSALLVLVSLPLLVPAAQAEDCVYEDLHGEFTLTVDCEGLQNFSGNSQEMKRIWLNGPLGEIHIMEAPEPYQTVSIEELMVTLGRQWSARRNRPVESKKVGDADALVATRKRTRVSSRTYVFKIDGQNVTARLVVLAPRAGADAALAKLEAAFLAGFSLN